MIRVRTTQRNSLLITLSFLVVIKLTDAILATATHAQASSGCGVILDGNEYILAFV
jgi:hypothetical protein